MLLANYESGEKSLHKVQAICANEKPSMYSIPSSEQQHLKQISYQKHILKFIIQINLQDAGSKCKYYQTGSSNNDD